MANLLGQWSSHVRESNIDSGIIEELQDLDTSLSKPPDEGFVGGYLGTFTLEQLDLPPASQVEYCVATTMIGFAYSGLQVCDLAVYMVVGKRLISNHPRYVLDFAVDQMVAYLLISASSAAATRAEDWVSNWGKDEFTQKAFASIALSFMAFAAFSLTSIISASHIFS